MSAENIHVAIRVRPMNESEESQGGSAVSFQPSEQASLVIKATDGQLRNFRFDQCFTSLDPQDLSGTQERVYSELGTDLVTSALDGYNCCLFAYGQTGAGKSHTMQLGFCLGRHASAEF
ncbi:Stard9 [Symbiodinium microadriaticum]|nr:Stard9 [Symbiodinium microadriaticum]CAE7363845.1 Stard9 [Symbiodinium sp. KB8]